MTAFGSLVARGGTKALQEILDKLARGHSHKFGYAWNYEGATVRREGKGYFIDYDGQTRYLGPFRVAVEHLSQYASAGRPNAAMTRAGSSSHNISQERPALAVVPVAAAPTITLHSWHIQAIQDYRKTEAAYIAARDAANARTEDRTWSIDDLLAVEKATEVHRQNELNLSILFESLAKEAGG
jgi:hypothetical protein